MDRFDDLTRCLRRAVQTPHQIRTEQRERWERRQGRLPEYRARELLSDSRGLFTPAEALSKMDVHLARHGRLVTDWNRKYPRLVIDLRAARHDLEAKIRAEGLSFLERAVVRRNFRATVSLLKTQGARHSWLSGTLSLNWRQKALYRFGELKPSAEIGREFTATGKTQAVVEEARRQSGRESVLRYEPSRDPRQGTYTELKRLQRAGLAEWQAPGVWRLDGRLLAAKLREHRPPLLSVDTLKRLQETQGPNKGESGFTPVAAPDTATRHAFAELEASYPQACRATAQGYQLNAIQLRKALYADRTRFVALWVTEQRHPPAVTQSDHRLAYAVAASRVHGERAVYQPDHDASGKGAQTVRYLRGLAMRRDQQAVRFGQGGSFLLDRREAVKLLNGHRQALLAYEQRQGRPEATLAASVVAAFARDGQPERDGSWSLAPTAGQRALVWRLHQSAALTPTAITQQADGRYRLSPAAARTYALPGTPDWAKQISERHAGLEGRTADLPRPDFRSIVLKDEHAPLIGTLAATTQATYARVARQQRQIPLEARPHYLVQRADELRRSAWWLEHAVLRRELRAVELAAGKDADLRRQCYELRTGVEAMDYQVLRHQDSARSMNPARQAVPPQVLADLKAELRARGDQELLDALAISKATGLRPGELARGVRLEAQGTRVFIHIQGGKRHDGVTDADARFRAERGADRVVEVSSPEISELARRHQGQFRPVSSPDALRGRLRQARQAIPGGENIRFYSFRHALKNHLEIEGHSRADIARLMGHRSTRSQEEYRTDL